MKKYFHNKPVLIGVVVFCLLTALTQSFSYQKYLLNERDEHQLLSGIAYRAKNQLQNSLYQSLSATKVLAFIVENYDIPKDFNAVAKELIESNKYIDAIELVQNDGVITHVYPLKGNEQALGYNVLKDPTRNKEAFKAIEKKALFFAGPFHLKQGGIAVVGRQPIFKNEKFFGFSAIIIKLPTLLKAAGIEKSDSKFIYQLSKINPDTGNEEFFIENDEVFKKENSISVAVPNGEWNLYVKSRDQLSYLSIAPFIALGMVFSLLGAVITWYKVKEPEELNKKVEEKIYMLNKVEKRYRIVAENSLQALFLGKPDGTILEANKAACELFGYTPEEFRQIGRDGLIDHSQDVYNAINERILNKESQGELYGVKKDGTHILCEYSSVIFKDDNGEEFSSVMVKDISDRKRLEEQKQKLLKEIQQSEERYRYLFDNNPLPIYIFNFETKQIIECNKAILDKYGYSREEFLSFNITDFRPDEDKALVLEVTSNENLFGKKDKTIWRHLKKNGEIVYVESTANIIDFKGEKAALVLVNDITEMLDAQKQKEFERRDKIALINNTDDLIWSVTDKLDLIAANDAFLNLMKQNTGVSLQPGDNIMLWDHFPKEFLNFWENSYKHVLLGKAFNQEVYTPSLNNIPETWSEISLKPIFNEERIVGIACYSRDITEFKIREKDRLLALNINKIFNSEDSLERLLPQILNEILLYCRKKAAEIWVVNMDESELHLMSQNSIDGVLINENETIRFKLAKGLPGKVWDSKSRIFIQDLQADKDFQRKDFALANKLVSALGIPIIFKDKVIGVLVVYSETANDTKDSFLKLSPSILTQLAFDIQRKKTETELNLMFNLSPDLICIAGMDGYFKKINPSFERLLGYKNEEILSNPYIDFIHPDDRERTLEMLQALFKEKRVLYYENRNVTKTGDVIWLSWTIAPLANETLIFATANNITQRKKQEEQILENTEFIVDILESIGDAFFTVDKNFTVTYWNNVAETMLYTARENILGKNLWDVFPDAKTLPSYINYTKTITEHVVSHFEDFYEPINKWFEISAYPSETGMSVYFKDITERKNADEKLLSLNYQLIEQARELSVSNAELEQFAYIASHDLQEPLRMITSFLTQLEKKYKDQLDEKANQYIFYAVDGAKRMREIILDLLEYSRVGKLDYKSELVDLNQIITEIQQIYHKQISEKHAQFEIDNLPTLNIFRTPVFQIFKNLIENALKYQKKDADALIKISCIETDTSWQFSVSDNGIGIDPEYFEKIFIIFQRLHNKTEYQGTGMGLAIVKKTVESMGGSIWVESATGKGSAFYFTILK